MAREKKNLHKVQMTDGKRQIIQQLIQEYDIETAEDIQDALIINAPEGDPVYEFMVKKRLEGKPYYVYMIAGCNKFCVSIMVV